MPEKTLKEKVEEARTHLNLHYRHGVEKVYEALTALEARVEELEKRNHELADIASRALLKNKKREILDMAKYEIKDIDIAIDGLLDERFALAAQAKTLLGEITDDSGRTVQVQLCLEARPEMFMPMEEIKGGGE